MININIRNILTGLLVLLVLSLCFVWPIPNNQILFHRNILIYPIIFISLGLFFSSREAKKSVDWKKIKFVLIIISLLTIFILVNGFFVASNIKEMIVTWNGQWFRPVLFFFSGSIILATVQSCFPSISTERFFTLIVLFFWGVVCIHLLDTIYLYWRDAVIHFGEIRVVYNRTRMSFQVNMITGFLVVELLARWLLHQHFLRVKTIFLVIILLCNFSCTVLVDTRLGTISLVGTLFSSFALVLLYSIKTRDMFITGIILLCVVATSIFLIFTSWNNDPRWKSLEDDIITGWNAPFDSFCYIKSDGNIPTNDKGYPINHSNGCRASFFHQGLKLLIEYPAGIGPHKEAFRYVLRQNTSDTRITISHSHYGLIEFGIQNGIVGIIGWLILQIAYFYVGWKELRKKNNIIGMFLLVFTIGFFSRTMVDHNMKDHYLEQYMFLSSLLIGRCAYRIKTY